MPFRSPGLKIVLLALLGLLLLAPLALVQGLIAERQGRAHEAEASVAQQWGAPQLLAPAYLTLDAPQVETTAAGFVNKQVPYALLPDSADIEATLNTEVRKRGMFAVPVYTTTLQVRARFLAEDVAKLRAFAPQAPLQLRMAVADPRGLRAMDRFVVNGSTPRVEAAGVGLGNLRALGVDLPADTNGDIVLEYQATLAGVQRFDIVPLARTTQARIAGSWPDPEFAGAFLPAEREVSAKGFNARWQVLEFNREFPQLAPLGAYYETTLQAAAFGLSLYQPADVYQQNERSGKYGVLVIALVFCALFLFEVIAGVALHPIQYLLVGLALSLFYLLLLALSEHTGFAPAYVMAAAAATTMVAGYGRAVLGSTPRAAVLAGLQGGAYAVFFVLVRSEDEALLLGSAVLFVLLALTMWLTRRIDWFAIGRASPNVATTVQAPV